jgi:signal transduction histidine kinase
MTVLRLPVRIALLAAIYTIVGRLGLMADPVGGFATLVWPPSGIALAALVLYGSKLWPGVTLGAFAVNFWVGAPFGVAAGISAGNTLEAVAGAWALSRIAGFKPSLERLKDVVALVALPACLSTAIGATIGATSLELGGVIEAGSFRDVWQAWWVGDMIGDLLVAPLLLTWGAPERSPVVARPVEALTLAATLLTVCLFVFGPWTSAKLEWLRRVNFLIPILMWAAIRFGPRGATAAAFVCSTMALWGTITGHGPFVLPGSLREAILGLQLYLPMIAATFLALGAVTTERAELLRRERAARREAERAVDARDDFLAVAAHELATPLTPLQLELETLHRSLDGAGLAPNVQRRLDRASRQTKRLARLTERLLDVSRLAHGHLTLDATDFDFSEMVREVVEEYRAEATRAGSELALTSPPALVGRWDRMRTAQVVANLLSNALKYGGGRPITLEVRGSPDDVVLEVNDQGSGIDPVALPRIFDRFERASPERRRGGLGLGLYVAREIVQAHGGRIQCDSQPGQGSKFVVTLPRHPPIPPGSAVPAPTGGDGAGAPSNNETAAPSTHATGEVTTG